VIRHYLGYSKSNCYLLPPYLEALISADHVARVVNRVIALMNIRQLISQEKIEGRRAYQMKLNLGFRRLRLRGLDKAGGEWILVCLVHNIKKIYARIMAKGVNLLTWQEY